MLQISLQIHTWRDKKKKVLIPLDMCTKQIILHFFFLNSQHVIFFLAIFNDLGLMDFSPPSFSLANCK